MTVFAEVKDTQLIKFPYTAASLREENPYTNYGSEPDLYEIFPKTDTASQNGYTLVPVTYSPQPSFDPATQICTQNDTPTIIENVWTIGWTIVDMTTEQQQEYQNQLIAASKAKAQSLLQATDWTEIPSVIDVSVKPHLANQSEFIAYRLALRAIAVNPTASPNWPTIPAEQWV